METTGPNKRISVSDLIFWIILIVLVTGAAYFLYTNRPCAKPVTYTIGTFDTQFGIGEGTFLQDANEAADLWNQAAGRQVLAYAASGTVPINLLYDTRQQETNVGQTIEQQKATISTDRAQIDALQQQYQTIAADIKAAEAAHQSIAGINEKINALNALAQQINSQRDALNTRIGQINAQVNDFNSQNGADFNEGEYISAYGTQKINIYEFQNHTQLVRVLAHEMGHALQLGHNSNPASIMYPINTATTIALTSDDKAELTAECSFSLSWFNQYHFLLPASWKW